MDELTSHDGGTWSDIPDPPELRNSSGSRYHLVYQTTFCDEPLFTQVPSPCCTSIADTSVPIIIPDGCRLRTGSMDIRF